MYTLPPSCVVHWVDSLPALEAACTVLGSSPRVGFDWCGVLPSFPPSLLPSFPPSLLPSFPPSLLPSFPPSLLPSFPPSPLPCLLPAAVLPCLPARYACASNASPTHFARACGAACVPLPYANANSEWVGPGSAASDTDAQPAAVLQLASTDAAFLLDVPALVAAVSTADLDEQLRKVFVSDGDAAAAPVLLGFACAGDMSILQTSFPDVACFKR